MIVVVNHPKHYVELMLCTVADTEALCDWCDVFLAGDYFFRRKHMQGLLARDTSRVFAIRVDGVNCGMVVLYKGSMLHNFYLQPGYRELGLGSAIIAKLQPSVVRAKTNMVAGDPTGFYERNGFTSVAPDPQRPHITVMTRDAGMAPHLLNDLQKKEANKQRMAALRAKQQEKRALEMRETVAAALRAAGVAPIATPIAAGPAPIDNGAPAAAAPPPSPPPPAAAPRPEDYVVAGSAGQSPERTLETLWN